MLIFVIRHFSLSFTALLQTHRETESEIARNFLSPSFLFVYRTQIISICHISFLDSFCLLHFCWSLPLSRFLTFSGSLELIYLLLPCLLFKYLHSIRLKYISKKYWRNRNLHDSFTIVPGLTGVCIYFFIFRLPMVDSLYIYMCVYVYVCLNFSSSVRIFFYTHSSIF